MAYRRPDAAEYPIYVALKLYVHERSRRETHKLATITPRWLHALLQSAGRTSAGMAELHGVTSHFLRERLRNLNHGTALQELKPGLRQALTFMWNEPPNPGSLHSYAQLSALLGGRTLLAVDIARVAAHFGTEPFDDAAFVDLFRAARKRLFQRPWYALRGAEDAAGPDYSLFLVQRRELLAQLGFLVPAGDRWRLGRKGELCTYWFELLVHSVDYPVNRPGAAPRSPTLERVATVRQR
ncbi:MAG: hypothetical protein QOI63_518 [Thermoplasmata archaeon]|jgi:hypothetical protein|nr:hypothetical protein [Thermoplasmata archaeon]